MPTTKCFVLAVSHSETPLISQNRCDAAALLVGQPFVVDTYLTDVANERLPGLTGLTGH